MAARVQPTDTSVQVFRYCVGEKLLGLGLTILSRFAEDGNPTYCLKKQWDKTAKTVFMTQQQLIEAIEKAKAE